MATFTLFQMAAMCSAVWPIGFTALGEVPSARQRSTASRLSLAAARIISCESSRFVMPRSSTFGDGAAMMAVDACEWEGALTFTCRVLALCKKSRGGESTPFLPPE